MEILNSDIEDKAEQDILDNIDGVDMPDLIRIYKLGMKFALKQTLKGYISDGNPENWKNKIEALLKNID